MAIEGSVEEAKALYKPPEDSQGELWCCPGDLSLCVCSSWDPAFIGRGVSGGAMALEKGLVVLLVVGELSPGWSL